jgi:phospholipid transport system substrate-binding protein
MINHENASVRRRNMLALGAAALVAGALPWRSATAQSSQTAAAPVEQLDAALLVAMKAGGRPFADRYRALAPVIEQVFNLDAVLATSIGLTWASLPDAQKAVLGTSFRRYMVSSYVANFDSFSGQSFQILPAQRTIGDGEVVVQSRLLQPDGASVALDYVMRRGPEGWQAVDVLAEGSISRVAVQRSDFRALLANGGVTALVASLDHKVANLSGGMVG